ncbi:MAG: hypothetical protein JO139_08210 [Alphaproteobacteria bacterium]|nr:hypothetical protein [Alphaproteobacteria bacterium]
MRLSKARAILGAGTVARMTSDHLGPISRNTESARRLLGPGYAFWTGVCGAPRCGREPDGGLNRRLLVGRCILDTLCGQPAAGADRRFDGERNRLPPDPAVLQLFRILVYQSIAH